MPASSEPVYLKKARLLVSAREYAAALRSVGEEVAAQQNSIMDQVTGQRFRLLKVILEELVADVSMPEIKRLDRHAEIEYIINRIRGDKYETYRSYARKGV